jgi:tetratricopeptide (TPR) repeat protein
VSFFSAPALLEQALQLHRQGRLSEAEALYLRLIDADPAMLQARHMLGLIRAAQGRNEEALALIGAVAALSPGDALAHYNHGNVLNALGRGELALQAFDHALALAPDYVDALNNRGNALLSLGRAQAALADYDCASALAPGFALAHKNRGDALVALKQVDAALAAYDRAISLAPDLAGAHAGRGGVMRLRADYAAALACYDRALALCPDDALIMSSRAVCLQNLGRSADAQAALRTAMDLAPELAAARLNLAFSLMTAGDFEQGLPLYEWRKRLPVPMESRDYAQPCWTGREDIAGKLVYLYIDQGLGDAIMFARFAPLVQARGAQVILAVPACLLDLLAGLLPAVPLQALDAPLPEFDFHCALASLPLALSIRLETLPAPPRYLVASRERMRDWGARIGADGFRIGIAWEGNSAIDGAEGKSFPLRALAPLSHLPGVRLISLQKNAGSEQLQDLPAAMRVEQFAGLDDGPGAFLDSAAIMENLDLVISADTAPAHLAGALGVPAWIALKFMPDWRWFLDRSDSPWYPSLRLFRQAAPGDWPGVFAEMEKDLRRLLAGD